MVVFFLPMNYVKRETEKAFQLQCPAHSYSYARARFWLSKSCAKLKKLGSLEYLEIQLPSYGEYELVRYWSRREAPERFKVSSQALASMYTLEHDQVMRRLAFERKALEADYAFEKSQQSFTRETTGLRFLL